MSPKKDNFENMNTLANNNISTITTNINNKEVSIPIKEVDSLQVEEFVEEVSQFFNREMVEAAARATGFVYDHKIWLYNIKSMS
jgi:hypothetical protein